MTYPLQPIPVIRPSFHEAVIAAVAVRIAVSLEKLPFEQMLRTLERWSTSHPTASKDLAQRYFNAVCFIDSRCRGNQGCLRRSIAIVAACHLSRRSVTWCTGFASPPFRAHAWVEVQGQPVNERPEIVEYVKTVSIG